MLVSAINNYDFNITSNIPVLAKDDRSHVNNLYHLFYVLTKYLLNIPVYLQTTGTTAATQAIQGSKFQIPLRQHRCVLNENKKELN